jgi:hypothetical protein
MLRPGASMPLFLEGRLEIIRGDLTTLQVDAIVNAANATLHLTAAKELLGG